MAGMELEQVVVVVIEIKRTALAGHTLTRRTYFKSKRFHLRFICFELGVLDLEGDVVVGPRWQWLTLHDCDPEIADLEKFLARDGEGFLAAGIDFTGAENTGQNARHPFQIANHKCHVRQSFDHSAASP
jgi:hypothetical protein